MPDSISFAMNCKEESVSSERGRQQRLALLSAFVKGSGSLRIGAKEELVLSTESSLIAKAMYTSFTEEFGAKCRFAYTRGIGFRKKVKYHVLIENPDPILKELCVDFFTPSVPDFVKGEEMRASYIAGAFISGGSVNDPSSSNYHLEIAVDDGAYAQKLMRLIQKMQVRPFHVKLITRRKEYVVYLKHSEEISDFLILIDAKECCLHFEGVRLDRDYANITNRLENLDAANMSKTNAASERQIKEITYFRDRGEMFKENPKLEILCSLRLKNPDASLEELADLLSEELAVTISKSNINHLFRHLHSLYLEEHPNEK